ncbi:HAD-IA family hydrolase [Bacillus aerolatus]|uniref:HAD-IA family hydrolase n=1 Tax=Bacillus aerolatus TaxID=2653354 RepID=A0A6I1FP10_9BACI|nr:HAD family hydrolase [Bacillus aerolatus]KAB7708174.1 HAD-IA family hydrolase [Bacillus aerolatus]
MKINALVFDIDDTLYQEIDYVLSGFRAVDMWLENNFDITDFYGLATDLFNSGERANVFNKTLELLNVSFNESMISKMVSVYRAHKPEIELLDDAKWVIDNLHGSIKKGIISDGYLITQKQKVEALNLKEKFHTIILSDIYGRSNWKPSPMPYREVTKGLSCLHNECVYIGDNLKKDFVTAKKLGWLTVHVKRTTGIYSNLVVDKELKAHYQINDLRELINIRELRHLFDIDNQERVVVK